MRFLLFRLYAPLGSWGEVAVGAVRPSHAYPSRSALLGLIGAALGLRRDAETWHVRLGAALGFAVAVYEEGALLRDYHTVQVPGRSLLKRFQPATRADELAFPRSELNTIVSTRDYWQDALSVAGVWQKNDDPDFSLERIADALRRPHFVLYLGRKSCPPALPLAPRIVEAEDFQAALAQADFPPVEELRVASRPRRIAGEAPERIGAAVTFSVPRKDEPLSRRRWQFGDRIEYVALLAQAEAAAEEEAG
jgi:CRISPR system Cascade subunit CasD